MKIVILDGYALNPGDLSWQAIENLANVTIYDRTAQADVLTRVGGAQLVLTNKVVFDRDLMSKLPHLKYIGVTASGYNIIDLEAASEFGIVVTNVPNYSTPTVAQHVFALLLEAYVHVGKHNRLIKANEWAKSADFCFYQPPFNELYQKTFGVIGYGNIGKAVTKIAHAFGMHVLIYDRGRLGEDPYGKRVSLDELLKQSDIVSLHLPLKQDTEHLINAQSLKIMKDDAILINTARAPLVAKDALLDALNNKELAMYVSDVFDSEPPALDDPLIMHPQTIFTGHMAWASYEARQRCMAIVVENIQGFLNQDIKNQVN
ncbi:MAG: D-2-hydroxyacid dehydrogenase [Erysipelothrix sp.]|jgi:glycerate dehydrogenase|nr:D-2-hydroxyacid dehydrogenase [Erysipelothrix sp.]